VLPPLEDEVELPPLAPPLESPPEPPLPPLLPPLEDEVELPPLAPPLESPPEPPLPPLLPPLEDEVELPPLEPPLESPPEPPLPPLPPLLPTETLWTYKVTTAPLLPSMASLFWIVMPKACRSEAQTVRVGLQLGTFASTTLKVTVCQPEDASSEEAFPRSSDQELSTPLVLA
jgi:hypothetical protein